MKAMFHSKKEVIKTVEVNEEDMCNNCKYNKFGHTTLIPNIVITEWYCRT